MSKVRTPNPGGTLKESRALLTGVALAIFFFWVSFTASISRHELMLGVCATGLTLALFFNLLRADVLPFHLRLRDLLLVRQLPQAILKDCWILSVVLWKDITGKERAGSFYRACGFTTSANDPVRIGRSALATVYTTASPNMLVIGIDPAQSLMLFHQLQRDPVPAYTQALGAAGQHAPPPHPPAGAAS